MVGDTQDRRERILTSAAELFARKGVAATTVRQIADEVGILSGSLYHHFESKDAIVDEIVSSYLEDLRTRYQQATLLDGDPRDRLHYLVLATLQMVDAYPHATEICQNDANYLRSSERFDYLRRIAIDMQNIWVEVIEAGVANGMFRSDLDPKVFYRLVRDSLLQSVRWFKPSRERPLTRLAEDCTTLYLDGLATGRS